MMPASNVSERLQYLVDLACTSELGQPEALELEELLRADEASRQFYAAYCQMHAGLLFAICEKQAMLAAKRAVRLPQATPPIISIPNAALHNASGLFSSGWPVAYLVATVILGIGLLIGEFIHVSQPLQVVDQSPPAPQQQRESDLNLKFVGRITGLLDCQWADPTTAVPGPVAVPLGRKYALASGLMEITYDTGAKVILEGPCTYEVESRDGGYLAVGKLTARIEKKEERKTRNEELSASRSSFLIPHSYFAVRTPTATVTDLGTEFGVEVGDGQATRVCVLQGSVSLRSSLNNTSERVLERGQSASVDTQGTVAAQSNAETVSFVRSFVRCLPGKSHPISVSLTDLVAGGNGFGDRSCWGINPLDASVIMGAHPAPNQYLQSTGQYQRYNGSPCIDGVFIPDGSNGMVQLDSAGHTFALPTTSGKTVNWGVWGYRGEQWEVPHRDPPSIKAGATLSSMLFLPTNVGITFDLVAIQTAAAGRKPIRFVTTARNCPWTADAPFESTVDVWVFVDGQLRFKRLKLCAKDGSQEIDIPFEPNARFLTLVATEGDDTVEFDELCLLNPCVLVEAVDRRDESTTAPQTHERRVADEESHEPAQ